SLWRKGVHADRGSGASVACRRLGARKQFLIMQHLGKGQPRDAATGLKQKIAPIPDIFHFNHLVYKNSLRLSTTFAKSTSEPDPIMSVAMDGSAGVGARVSASRYARSICLPTSSPASFLSRSANSCAWRMTKSSFISVSACVGTVDVYLAPKAWL